MSGRSTTETIFLILMKKYWEKKGLTQDIYWFGNRLRRSTTIFKHKFDFMPNRFTTKVIFLIESTWRDNENKNTYVWYLLIWKKHMMRRTVRWSRTRGVDVGGILILWSVEPCNTAHGPLDHFGICANLNHEIQQSTCCVARYNAAEDMNSIQVGCFRSRFRLRILITVDRVTTFSGKMSFLPTSIASFLPISRSNGIL
jgi:hypothetical protein